MAAGAVFSPLVRFIYICREGGSYCPSLILYTAGGVIVGALTGILFSGVEALVLLQDYIHIPQPPGAEPAPIPE